MRALFFAFLLTSCDGDLRFAAPRDAAADSPTAVECTRDESCTRDRLRRCDVASGRCVECGLSSDCNEDEACDPITKQCLHRCGETSGCPLDTPFCDPRGYCVCTATSCTSGERSVCGSGGRCVECANDSHCTEGGRCDLARGECGE